MSSKPLRCAAFIWVISALIPATAAAKLPDTATLMGDLGYSADEIAQLKAGKFLARDTKPASDRELVSSFAFFVAKPPAELVKGLKAGLLASEDPNTISSGPVSNPATSADFAKLALEPDAEKQAAAYRKAAPGDALNLSDDEIAAFKKLGSDASVPAVEDQIRAQLLARAQAYQSRGLGGMAPYSRGGGKSRAPAEELRTSSQASVAVKNHAPDAHQMLLSYPQKPAGTEEVFRWTLFEAHGVPTIVLTHGAFIPDGDARIAVQRQYYVSTGYNTEEAVAAFLPVDEGTIVVYGNRTSTDQVAGFGGGAKRSIGSKLLSSQLQALFEKVQAAAK